MNRLGRVEPVAEGLAPGAQSQRPHRDDVLAVQRDQAVRRGTNELQGGHAVGQLVAHRLGNREPASARSSAACSPHQANAGRTPETIRISCLPSCSAQARTARH